MTKRLVVMLTVGVLTILATSRAQTVASPQPPASPATASVKASTARITSYTLPPELYQKARRLSRWRFVYRFFASFYSLFVLWLVLQMRWSARFRDWAKRVSRWRFVQAMVFTALFALAVAILEFPLDVLEQYVARLYKLSIQPWGSWLGDWAKAEALLILLGGILVWILYAVIRWTPRRWWLCFWLLSLPILLFVFFISPFVIDPMFNKFEPLASKDPQLIPLLEKVTHRAGENIPPDRMFWMKASDKTNFTNAYVTGIGASKRVVIWDTTIEKETPDEVAVDFGHEMGHYVLGHVWRMVVFSAAMFLVLMYLGYRFIGWLLARYGTRWNVRGLEDWASLPALLLIVTLFGFVANVAGNCFSRYQEHQADVYAMEVTHGLIPDPGQAAAHDFEIFGQIGLADPKPNPVNVFLFYDHPSVPDRVHFFVTYDPWGEGKSPEFVK